MLREQLAKQSDRRRTRPVQAPAAEPGSGALRRRGLLALGWRFGAWRPLFELEERKALRQARDVEPGPQEACSCWPVHCQFL